MRAIMHKKNMKKKKTDTKGHLCGAVSTVNSVKAGSRIQAGSR